MVRSVVAMGLCLFVGLPGSAHASVSYAVDTDRLLTRAELVIRATPLDDYCTWEGTRIVTYTKLHVDERIAGETKESDIWVRSLGGEVEHLAQWVDGEPVFTIGQPTLMFLGKDTSGAYVSVARAQGQMPMRFDETTKTWVTRKNPYVGVLVPRKAEAAPPSASTAGKAATPTTKTAVKPMVTVLRPAVEELAERPLDELRTELRSRWTKVHRP